MQPSLPVLGRKVPLIIRDPPAGVTATPGDQEVALSWNAVDDADTYNVYRAQQSGGPYAQVASGISSPIRG
jgi:hypothetical protein